MLSAVRNFLMASDTVSDFVNALKSFTSDLNAIMILAAYLLQVVLIMNQNVSSRGIFDKHSSVTNDELDAEKNFRNRLNPNLSRVESAVELIRFVLTADISVEMKLCLHYCADVLKSDPEEMHIPQGLMQNPVSEENMEIDLSAEVDNSVKAWLRSQTSQKQSSYSLSQAKKVLFDCIHIHDLGSSVQEWLLSQFSRSALCGSPPGERGSSSPPRQLGGETPSGKALRTNKEKTTFASAGRRSTLIALAATGSVGRCNTLKAFATASAFERTFGRACGGLAGKVEVGNCSRPSPQVDCQETIKDLSYTRSFAIRQPDGGARPPSQRRHSLSAESPTPAAKRELSGSVPRRGSLPYASLQCKGALSGPGSKGPEADGSAARLIAAGAGAGAGVGAMEIHGSTVEGR